MKVKLVNKSKHQAPHYATSLSAGLDLRANIDEEIQINSMERRLIPTGLFLELPKGFEAQIRSRSGLALKSGISVLNSPGTIDADYRGEIMVLLINLSAETFVIKDGERIAQMIIAKHETISWELVENLEDTERGSGGFGHTGKS